MPKQYDFSGWATKNDLRCSDGRTIRKDAFKDCDGKIVPLVYQHNHDDPKNVLGHALLKNREEGVYAYCSFNNTAEGQHAKEMVNHGDIVSLSIYANNLQQRNGDVLHGVIREVSLVLAGANPGAFIDFPQLTHGDGYSEEEATIYNGELIHADAGALDDEEDTVQHKDKSPEESGKDDKKEAKEKEKTVQDVFNELTEEQKNVVYFLIGQVLEDAEKSDEAEHSDIDKEEDEMKKNVFDKQGEAESNVLSHADQMEIVSNAKKMGKFSDAWNAYVEDNVLQHDDETAAASGFAANNIELLFPEYKDMRSGAPELVTDDMGWVSAVMNKAHKTPFSRIRTGQVDIRNIDGLRAKGYDKGKKKALTGNYNLVRRTTDPQTVYVKNALNRDDIVDITDFDYVAYQYNIDRMMLNEEIATAALIGDGREDGDADKISPEHIRPIWTDDELYTIHYDLDLEKTTEELQGSATDTYFGENFIYSEAMVNALTYARETYRGTGTAAMFCDPHLINVMLLARDRNGHRVYASKAELATALGVSDIYPVEKFKNLTRTSGTGQDAKTKKLVALVVNMADYNFGATKGGEITHFNQFDIDFNQEKSLIETRLSGALHRIKSAIAIEEDVTSGE